MNMHLTMGAYLSRVKTQRAAVLPYTILEENGIPYIYFLVAVDSRTGDITDLGGGVKKYECSLIAALREFKEETNEIFGGVYDDVNDSSTYIAAVHNKMSVLFIPMNREWFKEASILFNKQKTGKKVCREVSKVLWLRQDDFEELFGGDKMWSRLRSFYKTIYSKKLLELLSLRYELFIYK